MKKLFALLLSVAMLLTLVACNTPEATTTTETRETETSQTPVNSTPIRLMALQGPTGMGLAKLLQNDKAGSGNRADYDAQLVTSAEISNIAAAITQGNCDIAAVPINLASTLYAKTKGQVQILAANTLGVLHILENGDSIKSVSDLRGKTIYATGKGSTPEYVLRYVLKQNGLDPDRMSENGLTPDPDVTITFVADHTELASMMAANVYSIGMLPEPNVSVVLSSNPDFRVALDMTAEWNKVLGSENQLVQGVFIARRAFVEEHPDWVNAFMDDYNESQKFVNSDPKAASQLIAEAGILAKAPIAEKAIPGCHITFLEGDAMKGTVSKCLEVLFEAAPTSVGGALPKDDIYYKR